MKTRYYNEDIHRASFALPNYVKEALAEGLKDKYFNTILFDLDGTLLPIDGQAFEKIYFGNLAKQFMDVYEPKVLIQLIWGATKIMVKDTSDPDQ